MYQARLLILVPHECYINDVTSINFIDMGNIKKFCNKADADNS